MPNRVDGTQEVIQRINAHLARIENQTLKGLIRGAIFVIRDTEKTPPLTPLDEGNLRASRFVVTSDGDTEFGKAPRFGGERAGRLASDHGTVINSMKSRIRGDRPKLIMGYTAFYAIYVHEQVGVMFQRPGAGAKWFEAALKRNERNITNMVAKEART